MYTATRVLIFGKTYPELSAKYTETVCTGGFREDGTPIRLYPVPLRYLEGQHQYQLYEWITVPIRKSTSDPRPESFKIVPDKIERGELMGTDDGSWRRRREIVFKDPSWHFGGMDELKAAQKSTGRSIGMVRPGIVEDVVLETKPDGERALFEKKARELEAKVEGDFFHPDYKKLAFMPNEFRLFWRCTERCVTCKKKPHGMKVLDWGLLELARRDGWAKAHDRLRTLADLSRYDFRLFLGTFRLYPRNFGIIGMWYPKIPDQPSLL